ncbi:hypothetical protein DH2020_001767 [Rehmannia glutinosa]|uniref:Endonuclease/exonuclease/phosphatase domain-containing protein n=1 Tax=Rehmannia glutinosa TaxID=99300 RepID=A0ABR0XSD0_REHGL
MNMSMDLDHDQLLQLHVSSSTLPRTIHDVFIYAKCNRWERRPLWDILRNLSSILEDQPWLVWGDFNCIINANERTGSDTNITLDMEEFNELVSDCGFIDLRCTGPTLHTRVLNGLQERLDRILLSPDWNGTSHLSRAPTGTYGMINLHLKLMRVKEKLKGWNKTVFGNIFDNLKAAELKVQHVEAAYVNQPDVPNHIAFKKAIAELTLATKIEEDFWHQKFAASGFSDPELQKSAIEFFSKYLSNDCTCLSFDGDSSIPQLPHEFNSSVLIQHPSLQEVKDVVFSIDANNVEGILSKLMS